MPEPRRQVGRPRPRPAAAISPTSCS